MSNNKYTSLTNKPDNEKTEVAEQKQVKKKKIYRCYIPEYYLDNYEPIDLLELDYMTE